MHDDYNHPSLNKVSGEILLFVKTRIPIARDEGPHPEVFTVLSFKQVVLVYCPWLIYHEGFFPETQHLTTAGPRHFPAIVLVSQLTLLVLMQTPPPPPQGPLYVLSGTVVGFVVGFVVLFAGFVVGFVVVFVGFVVGLVVLFVGLVVGGVVGFVVGFVVVFVGLVVGGVVGLVVGGVVGFVVGLVVGGVVGFVVGGVVGFVVGFVVGGVGFVVGGVGFIVGFVTLLPLYWPFRDAKAVDIVAKRIRINFGSNFIFIYYFIYFPKIFL